MAGAIRLLCASSIWKFFVQALPQLLGFEHIPAMIDCCSIEFYKKLAETPSTPLDL